MIWVFNDTLTSLWIKNGYVQYYDLNHTGENIKSQIELLNLKLYGQHIYWNCSNEGLSPVQITNVESNCSSTS